MLNCSYGLINLHQKIYIMKRIINVDWLSMYCSSELVVEAKKFEFKRAAEGSAQFKEVWHVYNKEDAELYCIMQKNPYSPIIPKNAVMIKVANRYLYRDNWNIEFLNFCMACNITPKSISRIDICCDFEVFDNNLHPEQLIKGFLNNKYLKMRQSKYSLEGEQNDGQKFSYLRFGKRENEVSSYIYNKSKELREVKDKPYIRDQWEQCGIGQNKDVWRLEVSLRTTQLRTIVQSTGEILRLDLDFITTKGVLENIYNAVILKYFCFKINDNQKQKRRMKDLVLFKGMSTTLEMKVINDKPQTNRMDKIVVKKIANIFSQYRVEDQESFEKVHQALGIILDQTDLWDYYYERIRPSIGWYKER